MTEHHAASLRWVCIWRAPSASSAIPTPSISCMRWACATQPRLRPQQLGGRRSRRPGRCRPEPLGPTLHRPDERGRHAARPEPHRRTCVMEATQVSRQPVNLLAFERSRAVRPRSQHHRRAGARLRRRRGSCGALRIECDPGRRGTVGRCLLSSQRPLRAVARPEVRSRIDADSLNESHRRRRIDVPRTPPFTRALLRPDNPTARHDRLDAWRIRRGDEVPRLQGRHPPRVRRQVDRSTDLGRAAFGHFRETRPRLEPERFDQRLQQRIVRGVVDGEVKLLVRGERLLQVAGFAGTFRTCMRQFDRRDLGRCRLLGSEHTGFAFKGDAGPLDIPESLLVDSSPSAIRPRWITDDCSDEAGQLRTSFHIT